MPLPLVLAFVALTATQPGAHPAPQAPGLAVTVEGPGHQPALRLDEALDDPAFEEAVRSGLPLRLQFVVELWRDELFDDLVDRVEWTLVLQYEPLARRFRLLAEGHDSTPEFSSFDAARRALATPQTPEVRAPRPGRYYYLATLEVETLSLSDLEELETWLSGELRPAVSGRGSVSGALGRGLKRVLIRVLDLPVRRYVARSPKFEVG